jgi:hypothetical protein
MLISCSDLIVFQISSGSALSVNPFSNISKGEIRNNYMIRAKSSEEHSRVLRYDPVYCI